MESQHFDAIAVMFAARSRRQVLRALASAAAAGIVTVLRGSDAGAAKPCTSTDDCSKDPTAGQVCLNGECCARSRRCNNDTVCCPGGQWCTEEGCCRHNDVCHDDATHTNHCCGPCSKCEDGMCQPCGRCQDCVNGRCRDNNDKCIVCRPYGGGGTGAARIRAFAPEVPECGPCEDCDPDHGCTPKTCGACQVCDQTTGACVPKQCGDCQECVDGACRAVDCGDPCLECVSNSCRPKECDACAPCDPSTGACTPIDCGNPCLVCKEGACGPKCGTDQTCCDGDCVDTSSDPENCGGCGIPCTDPLAPDCINGICGCPSSTSCNYGGTSWCCSDIVTYPDGSPWQCCCNGRITWPSTGQETCNPCGIGTTFCYCNDGIGGWDCCRDGAVCAGCSGVDGSGGPRCVA